MCTASARIRELMYGDDAQEPREVQGQSQDTIQLLGMHTVKQAGFFLPPFISVKVPQLAQKGNLQNRQFLFGKSAPT